MIDVLKETLLTTTQAAKAWPCSREGKKTHPQTILKFINHGAKSHDGRIAKLEAVRMGGHWVTSAEAIQRFAEALTGQVTVKAQVRTPSARLRKAEKDGRELAKAGIY